MRTPANNFFSYVTVDFRYSNGTGYVRAYTGREKEALWMIHKFENCESRDEAELKAIQFLINGDPDREMLQKLGLKAYVGFDRNARIILDGFTVLEKGLRQNHKKNVELWKSVKALLTAGRDNFKFDIIRINDTFSKAIVAAETYNWEADNRMANKAEFIARTDVAIKKAKVERALAAKAQASATATVEHGPTATAEAA